MSEIKPEITRLLDIIEQCRYVTKIEESHAIVEIPLENIKYANVGFSLVSLVLKDATIKITRILDTNTILIQLNKRTITTRILKDFSLVYNSLAGKVIIHFFF